MENRSLSFEFGAYIGGASGTESGMTSGPMDDSKRIILALNELQGSAPSFLVRCYAGYHGADQTARTLAADIGHYVTATRKLDLVLCFQANESNMIEWKRFIATHIAQYGEQLRYLQITEEANVSLPSLDGYYSNSRKALVEGIIHAKKIIREYGYSTQVGFNATPDFNPNKTFWNEIKQLASQDFYDSLDYVGLDFFPGVFRPLPSNDPSEVEKLICNVIRAYKNDIVNAGIHEEIPLHITENGFATIDDKSEEQQSEMLSTIVSTLFKLKLEFNIRTYELFSLRDADSNVKNVFYQFGIMRDDYSPKQAFFTFRDLISRCSV
jgi:hypothetical protein